MDIALGEVQREGQEDVGAYSDDGVVAEEQLGGVEEVLLFEFEGVGGGGDFLATEVDLDEVRVADVERVGHSLEDEDGAFCEVVEWVDPVEVVSVHLKVARRVHHQSLLLLQLKRNHLRALASYPRLPLCVNPDLPWASTTSEHPSISSGSLRSYE